jgi:hypothetical protein
MRQIQQDYTAREFGRFSTEDREDQNGRIGMVGVLDWEASAGHGLEVYEA